MVRIAVHALYFLYNGYILIYFQFKKIITVHEKA